MGQVGQTTHLQYISCAVRLLAGRYDCDWHFSVLVTPHEFSRVASDVGVLAVGPAAGTDSINSGATHSWSTWRWPQCHAGVPLVLGLMAMPLRNNASEGGGLVRSARVWCIRL